MWNYIWPILVVIGANVLYNISTKSAPNDVNTFASLAITYFAATVMSVIMFFITTGGRNITSELSKINWTSASLAISVVALEFGYFYVYRNGWKVSVGSLVANIALACVLVFIGILMYGEKISPRQIIGMGVCAVGLFLVSK